MTPRRILLANVTLAGRSGTETMTRDLALALRAAGHTPMVYSPRLGAIAADIAGGGVPVAGRLDDLPAAPDIVHGNQHVELVAALLRFPRAPGLFVCHDRTTYWSSPPRLARIARYVAVDRYCLMRLTGDHAIPPERTRLIHNAVDLTRFAERPPLPPRPARAAVFSNYAAPGTHLESVREACDRLGLDLDVIGEGVGRSCAAPEQVLPAYDVVFAKARCAIEAMAVGAAVVLCDAQGLGGMVTASEVERMLPWNFGRSLLRQPLDPATIAREVQRYDPRDARRVSRYVREAAALPRAVEQYVQLYEEILAEPPAPDRSFEQDLDEYLQYSAGRVDQLFEQVDGLRSPFRMEPLSDRACAQVSVRIRSVPPAVAAGAQVQALVDVANTGERPLHSGPPFPVHLASRWFDAAAGTMVVAEGPRAALRPVVQPGAAATCRLPVTAPGTPGRYRLRVTLVQEFVTWFDWLEPPVYDDVEVTVRA